MGFLDGLFGKPQPTKKKPDLKKTANSAINGLRGQIEVLQKRETHLDKQVENCNKRAKAFVAKKNTRSALQQLKKKKMYEKQLNGLGDKIMNLESQIMNLEQSVINTETVKAMQQGTNAMKAQAQAINVENIDDMMEDMHEANDMQEEINAALNEPMNQDYDEDDLLDELKELEELEADEMMADLPTVNVTTQPADTNEESNEEKAPAKKTKAKTKEQADADELEAMLQM